ncbi:MAG: RagB/SusD family nutrient uptake outer membrane protein [Bacteroidales bacterium]|nr:RagB/SusD family nutrient uptake outer membrane protein [Bacteroidales bacterium]
MKKIKIKYIIALVLFLPVLSCTDLEEQFLDETDGSENLVPENIEQLIVPAYGTLFRLWTGGDVTNNDRLGGGLCPIQQFSTDEQFIPTRGLDWFDGGRWQADYMHTWNPEHPHITQLFNRLATGVARANYSRLLLDDFVVEEDDVDLQETIDLFRAELRFLTCYYNWLFMDIYGKVPYRDYTATDFGVDPEMWDRETAFVNITEELNELIPLLANKGEYPYGRPTKDAARMLLAKLYLNAEVYLDDPMYDECLTIVNDLINSGRYELADVFWDMFDVDNAANSEVIFAAVQDDEVNMGNDGGWNVHFQVAFIYNQAWNDNITGGWNGVCTPETYAMNVIANTDTALDMRWRDDRYYSDNYMYLGYNYGQQYSRGSGDSLSFGGQNVFYTWNSPLSGATRSNGARTIKFPPPTGSSVSPTRYPNDYPIFRIADAYLMRAECKLRLGDNSSPTPVEDVNAIRRKRNKLGQSDAGLDVTSMDLDKLLIERGIELQAENHRRTDMIRFGTYLEPKDNKPNASPETRLVCPIPLSAIDAYGHPDWQNPGY